MEMIFSIPQGLASSAVTLSIYSLTSVCRPLHSPTEMGGAGHQCSISYPIPGLDYPIALRHQIQLPHSYPIRAKRSRS